MLTDPAAQHDQDYSGAHTLASILTHWSISPASLPLFLAHPDGIAALALLCNAGAKDNPALYRFKAILVEAACRAVGMSAS
jgi:hypothetical protein